MSRKAYFALGTATVALILIALFTLTDSPPGGPEVAGTVGLAENDTTLKGIQKAERYRATQITEADVQLDNPELQALLQDEEVLGLIESEAFHRLVLFMRVREKPALKSKLASAELQRFEAFERALDQWQAELQRAVAQQSDLSRANPGSAVAALERIQDGTSNTIFHHLSSTGPLALTRTQFEMLRACAFEAWGSSWTTSNIKGESTDDKHKGEIDVLSRQTEGMDVLAQRAAGLMELSRSWSDVYLNRALFDQMYRQEQLGRYFTGRDSLFTPW